MKRRLLLGLASLVGVLPPLTFAADARQLVAMPAPAQAALREEMLDFMAALNEIVGLLGENKLAEAAQAADAKLGFGAMGRHRGAPLEARPGAHMPDAMHQQARSLHLLANDFAKAARGGDLAKAVAALQPVTATCLSCHLTYRVR
jgi:hypothetical protein